MHGRVHDRQMGRKYNLPFLGTLLCGGRNEIIKPVLGDVGSRKGLFPFVFVFDYYFLIYLLI